MDGQATLRKCRLFQDFASGDLDSMLAQTLTHSVEPGHVFIEMGAENRSLFIVAEGEVKVERTVGDEEVPLAVLEPGQTFGEMSLMDDARASATASVTASEPSTVLEVSREAFDQLLAANPKAWGMLWRSLAHELKRRLSDTNELVANYVDINRALVEDPSFREYYSQL